MQDKNAGISYPQEGGAKQHPKEGLQGSWNLENSNLPI